MQKELLKKLIADSNCRPMEKTTLTGFVEMAADWHTFLQADREFIMLISGEKKPLHIVVNTSEVKIYTVQSLDEWDKRYPYRLIYLNSQGVWVRCNVISDTLDKSLIAYLQQKHLGANSQFAEFAMKMLGMNYNS